MRPPCAPPSPLPPPRWSGLLQTGVAAGILAVVACGEPTSSPDAQSPPPIAPVAAIAQSGALSFSIAFASDVTWSAQNVCLNPLSPPNCPAGATLYTGGGAGAGWSADLSSIPSATWIWAVGIGSATSPAYPAEYTFSKTFDLPTDTPLRGTISVAADDFAEVIVNGTPVGTVGSVTDVSLAGPAQNSLTAFDIRAYLVPGNNVIAVRAANGVFGCGAGPYSCNPAGVVFGGVLWSLSPADLITELVDAVLALHLSPAGRENSLVVKLDGALAELERGNGTAACGLLDAFVQEAEAQAGKSLSAGSAADLIASAGVIAGALRCG